MDFENATFLNTRPKEVAAELRKLVSARWPSLRMCDCPVLDIAPDLQGLEQIAARRFEANTMILTSVQSLNASQAYHPILPKTCYVVGKKTAQAARNAGFEIKAQAENVKNLCNILRDTPPETTFLYLRGRHVSCDLSQILNDNARSAQSIIVYEQRLLPIPGRVRALALRENPIILPLFSQRSADHIAENWRGTAPLFVIALSTQIAARFENLSVSRMQIAERADLSALLDALAELLSGTSWVE